MKWSLFVSLAYHLMFMILTIEIQSWLLNFSNKTICIINLIRKAFSMCYRRHSELIAKYNVSFRTLLQQGMFYGDLFLKKKKKKKIIILENILGNLF